MYRTRSPVLVVFLVIVSALVVGCNQKMGLQPAYRPYTPSDLFADGTSARPIPGDTVARGHLQDDTLLFTGKDANGQDSLEFPFPITREVLDRGRDRFNIYCTPCHGLAGDGDGIVVQRGFNAPPSYHSAVERDSCGSAVGRALLEGAVSVRGRSGWIRLGRCRSVPRGRMGRSPAERSMHCLVL